MTEENLKKLGFVFSKQYPHDRFFTKRFKKGCLYVEFTYIKKTKEIATIDVTVDEVNVLPITFSEIEQLNKILNKQ